MFRLCRILTVSLSAILLTNSAAIFATTSQQASAMQLQVSWTKLSMTSLGSTSETITAVPSGGLTVPAGAAGATVSIASGLPSGVTASFSSPSLTSSGAVKWTLTLTGSPTALGSVGTLNFSSHLTDAKSGTVYAASVGVPLTVVFVPPTLNLSPALTHVPVVQGGTATDLFTFAGGGSFHGAVNLSVSGLPSGVTASWSSNPVAINGGAGASTLTLRVTSQVPVNWYTFTVTAAGDGLSVSRAYTVEVAQSAGIQVKLSQSTLSMTSLGTATQIVTATPTGGLSVPSGAAGATATILSALPTGVSASWSNPSVTASGAVNWTLTLSGSAKAVAGSSTLNLAAKVTDAKTGAAYTASQPAVLKVSLAPATLNFSPAVTHLPLQQGSSATDVFTFKGGGSFQGSANLSISGLPSGITASWSSNPVAIASGTGYSTLKLTANSSVPVNWYTFTVTATGDGLTVSWQYTVEVEQSLGVKVQLSQSVLYMQSMGTASLTLTATPQGKVTVPASAAGAIASIASGLPSGISASFSAPTVTSTGAVTWKLTLTGSTTAVASNGTLNVSAQISDASTGSVFTATQGMTFGVVLTPPTLAFSPVLTHLPVVQSSSATDVFNFTTGGSFHGAISLTVSGLPSGVTASWSSNPVTVSGGAGSSTLTLSANGSVTPNWYSFTVTAAGDGLSVSWAYTVEVEPTIGVTMQLSQRALIIEPQGTATLSVTATPVNAIKVLAGAAGTSATVLSGLPSGVTASWSAPTVTATGAVSWTLSLSADATALPGDNPVNLAVQITDKTSGVVYSARQSFPLLVSLLANVNIGSTRGNAVSSTFMGLSHEWNQAQSMMGNSSTGINSIYRQLLTNLTAYGSGPINLRIGGNSTDNTVEPTSTTVEPFVEIVQAVGAHFNLGVNLGSSNVNLATDQAKAYVNQMPAGSLDAIEIGNEPDLYIKNGIRPAGYTVQDYFSEFQTWRASIEPVIAGGTKLMGTAWSATGMLSNVQTFESAQSGALGAFSQHFYATSPVNNPAVDFLLTPTAATAGPVSVASAVITTHGYNLPFRMGETNSMSNAGTRGISDAFGAALWSIDTMFEYANVGVDGVNWEASDGNYVTPFYFASVTSKGRTTFTLNSVAPLYYGLLLFQNATQNGAKLLSVSLDTPANLKAWATIDASGTPRLVVINKDEVQNGNVSVSLPGYTQATVLRLTAPSYQSTSGVTLAGQTFDGSTDGTIRGTQTLETIDGTNGVFQLPMSITSAALVVFTK